MLVVFVIRWMVIAVLLPLRKCFFFFFLLNVKS
ncbi:40S ribosomal protein S30 [Plasmodium cynomolgi strain B]|uniref:40S ribosomal protein S30 n=1 Tax=Plasmodium cynomolgi (strain B) TaxID=1120755 RepID=K6V714_PLACD|nr:40S ribosomal protein S30 [Plasmodium cynomolgi strain B]GAB64912.1 40S ribosomal protein S30 [Plasmodium cynomolgi strain B]